VSVHPASRRTLVVVRDALRVRRGGTSCGQKQREGCKCSELPVVFSRLNLADCVFFGLKCIYFAKVKESLLRGFAGSCVPEGNHAEGGDSLRSWRWGPRACRGRMPRASRHREELSSLGVAFDSADPGKTCVGAPCAALGVGGLPESVFRTDNLQDASSWV